MKQQPHNGGQKRATSVKSTPALCKLTATDLGDISWNEVAPGLYRIVADVTCPRCGAYQAASCSPTSRKDPAIRMILQLLNAFGWRVNAQQILCPDCALK